jgi:hypothetical protein
MWTQEAIENGSRKHAAKIGDWDSFGHRLGFMEAKIRQIAIAIEIGEKYNQSKIALVDDIKSILDDVVNGG